MKENDRIVKELQAIKKLLMLLLARSGATSDDIAKVLEMHPGSVRKMVPMRGARKP